VEIEGQVMRRVLMEVRMYSLLILEAPPGSLDISKQCKVEFCHSGKA
jgi:hypothetical protein